MYEAHVIEIFLLSELRRPITHWMGYASWKDC